MHMRDYIRQCGEITLLKGFKPHLQPGLQVLLIASEVSEAIEEMCIRLDNEEIDSIEKIRREKKIEDKSFITEENIPAWLEELADVVIRVFSLVHAFDFNEYFLRIFEEKMQKNRGRQMLHGKRF